MDPRDRPVDSPDGGIGDAQDAFVGAIACGDATSASASYTPDARLLAPSAELFRGRSAIERFWKAGVDTGISEVRLETLELVQHSGLAYEIGTYALDVRPADGLPLVDRGKYLRIHEQQPDGTWLWAAEMFNPDARAPRANPARTQGGTR